MTRDFIASWHRKNQVISVRHYVRLETAVRRLAELAVLEGEPKDTIELAHAHTGRQLGTIKIGVGTFTASWIWER